VWRETRESEKRYRKIVETTNEGVWLLNSELRTYSVNRQMEEMLGYEPGEMVGHSVFDFYLPEDCKKRFTMRSNTVGYGTSKCACWGTLNEDFQHLPLVLQTRFALTITKRLGPPSTRHCVKECYWRQPRFDLPLWMSRTLSDADQLRQRLPMPRMRSASVSADRGWLRTARHGLTAKLRTLEVPPAQSTFTEDVAEDVALLPNVTGCDCGGLKTVTFTAAGAARSSAVMVVFS
jgi:PAS fold